MHGWCECWRFRFMKKDCNGPMALRGHPCHRSLAHDHAPDYTSAMNTARIWIWMTKRPGVTCDGNFNSYLICRNWYNHFRSFPMSGNGNNTIYPLLSTWITTWTKPEALYDSVRPKFGIGRRYRLKLWVLVLLSEPNFFFGNRSTNLGFSIGIGPKPK